MRSRRIKRKNEEEEKCKEIKQENEKENEVE